MTEKIQTTENSEKKQIIVNNPDLKEFIVNTPELEKVSELYSNINENSENLAFFSNIFDKTKLLNSASNDLKELKNSLG